MFEKLLSMGAKEYQPPTNREEGFITAAVIDPFGNILGDHVQPALSGGAALEQKRVTIATGYERRKRTECCGGRRGWRIRQACFESSAISSLWRP
jgi:hypothetical protein